MGEKQRSPWLIFGLVWLLTCVYVGLILIATSGCATGALQGGRRIPLCRQPTLVVVDKVVWTEDIPIMVRDAVAFWNEKVGRTIFEYGGREVLFDSDLELKPPFIGVRSAPDWVEFSSLSVRGKATGWIVHTPSGVCRHGGVVWLRDIDGPYYRRYHTVVHELGHLLLGLYHSGDVGTIMYWQQSPGVDSMELGADTEADIYLLYGDDDDGR